MKSACGELSEWLLERDGPIRSFEIPPNHRLHVQLCSECAESVRQLMELQAILQRLFGSIPVTGDEIRRVARRSKDLLREFTGYQVIRRNGYSFTPPSH